MLHGHLAFTGRTYTPSVPRPGPSARSVSARAVLSRTHKAAAPWHYSCSTPCCWLAQLPRQFWTTQQATAATPARPQSCATAWAASRRRSRCQSTATRRRRSPPCHRHLRLHHHPQARRSRARRWPSSAAAAPPEGSTCPSNRTTTPLRPAATCHTTTPLPRHLRYFLRLLLVVA